MRGTMVPVARAPPCGGRARVLTLAAYSLSNHPPVSCAPIRQSDLGSGVGHLRVHVEGDDAGVAHLDHVSEGRLENDLALPPAGWGAAGREPPAVGCLEDFLGQEMHLVEHLACERLALASALVTVEHARDRRVARVAPLDLWVEQGDDPLDAMRFVGVVAASHQLDCFRRDCCPVSRLMPECWHRPAPQATRLSAIAPEQAVRA